MAQYAYASKLSDNIALTAEGYLICTNAVICRSGVQQYHRSELDESSGSNELVDVFRPEEEVTAKEFLASIAGKGFTVNHPGNGFLNSMNHSWSARGTVLNPRVGPPDKNGDITILADILITDPDAIRRVMNGMRELSCGYQYALAEGPHGLEMRDLRFNHLALVEAGRAGTAQIQDAGPAESYEAMMKRFHRVNANDAAAAGSRAKDAVLNWGGGVNNYHELPGGQGDTTTLTPSEEEVLAIEQEDEINENEIEDNDMTNEQIDRLCALLERLEKMGTSAKDESLISAGETKSERPENPIVDDLRQIRPVIEASRDRKSIDAFNNAMRAAKRGNVGPARNLIAAYDRQPRAEFSFNELVDRRREELLNSGKLPSEPMAVSAPRVAQDRRPAESFEENVSNMRRRMLADKTPRS